MGSSSRIGNEEIPVRAIMPNAGAWQDVLIDISEDDDLTAEIDLGDYYSYLNIVIPALTSANVSLYVATETGGTFYALDSAVFAAGTGTIATTFVLGGWRYIKIATSAGQAANRTFTLRGVTL